LYWKN